jgi:hypothetical protein
MLSAELQCQRTGLRHPARTLILNSIAYNRIVQTGARQPAPALSNVNMDQPTEPHSQLPLVTCFSALLQLTCSSFHRAPLLRHAPCCREDMHRRWCQHDVEQTQFNHALLVTLSAYPCSTPCALFYKQNFLVASVANCFARHCVPARMSHVSERLET